MWSRENFSRLKNFINAQDLFLGDFKLFDITAPSKQSLFRIEHGLTFTPEDIISLSAEGDQNYYFRFQEFDKRFIYVTTNGPVKFRFLAGKLKDPTTSGQPAAPFDFVAPGDVIRPSSPGFVFGAVDSKTSGFWMTSEGIPSNVVGVPVLFGDAVVVQAAVGTEVEANYTIGIYQHEGSGINITQIGTFAVTNGGTKRVAVSFPIVYGSSNNVQLACRLESGNTKNLKVSLIVRGSAI